MNELLQKHGCANVFTVPEGLKELMADISREVLRDQPPKIFDYIANYLSVLLITREHGILAVKILDDLCDCRPSVSEHLIQVGVSADKVEMLSSAIKEEIEGFEPEEGKAKLKETQILKKILTRATLDEDMSAKVCQVARNAYRDYWYRKKLMEKNLKVHPEEPWEVAAQHTLELYKRTRPSLMELNRATQKIQAAYKGYHVRRNILRHLKPKVKKSGPKVELSGPPIDVAGSRELDLGRIIDIKVREDNVTVMFVDHVSQKLGLQYDPMRTITHVEEVEEKPQSRPHLVESRVSSPAKSQESRLSSRSAKSAHSVVDKEEKPSEIASQLEDHRQSRIATIMAPGPHHSRLRSVAASANPSLQRISFVEVPPETIDVELVQADPEVPEELLQADDAPGDTEEIPEDISGDRTDGDGESVPTASAPSSAGATDVEDAGEVTDGE